MVEPEWPRVCWELDMEDGRPSKIEDACYHTTPNARGIEVVPAEWWEDLKKSEAYHYERHQALSDLARKLNEDVEDALASLLSHNVGSRGIAIEFLRDARARYEQACGGAHD